MAVYRFKISQNGEPVLVGVSPDGKSPPLDLKTAALPKFCVSYDDLMEAARTGKPIVLTPADDQS